MQPTRPPAMVLVRPVSQSLVVAGRSRSIVIPPRMFGQARDLVLLNRQVPLRHNDRCDGIRQQVDG